MKNNESESSSLSNQRLKSKKIASKKQINKKIIDNNDNSGKREYDTNVIFSRMIKPSNFYKYRKMSSKIYNQTNTKINTTIKKSKFDEYNNNSNSKRSKLINSKANEKNNLFLPTANNNLKADISAYLLNSKNNKGIGTKLDISKSEIQYPLNYSKNDINNKNNITNSSQESKNKEINLRISLKIGNKNNKEKERKYNISSPLNKANHSFNKKLRKSMKNLDYINKRKNNETYSPDLIKFTNNLREMKSFNNNNFYTKRENARINTFNSCYNFYQKDDFNTRRKKEERNFNDSSFNNTMNHNNFHNYGINNENDNSYQLDYENMNRNNKYFLYRDDVTNINDNITDRYKIEDINDEIQKNIKENEYLSYQNEIIEEFCNCVEEFMFWRVKNNFDRFISKLKECLRTKYFNSLLLKRIQNQSIKKKFSNNQYLSSTLNTDNKINTYKKLVYPSNKLSKDCFKRKTMTNFSKSNLGLSNKFDKNKENTYHRKSQEKFNLKNLDSFYKNRNTYDINNEKFEKERRISNEKYDTNLYIPKKYRHLDNANANQTNIKKNISYNYSQINPYFTSINDKKDMSQNLIQGKDYTNISADMDEDIIKTKLERSANKKNKKNKNHNISCDNKYNTNYYLEKGIISKIKSNISNNLSMTMNTGQIKDKNNNLPIYNKKKVRISQPKSKIFMNKQLHGNIKDKTANKIKGESMLNLAHNKIINNKNKNNNEHYGIMTLSSNLSDNSEDMEQNKKENNDLNEYKMISPKNNNYSSNPINNKNNIDNKENNIKYQENIINNQKLLNSEKINEQNGNGYKIGINQRKNNIKNKESNIKLNDNNNDIKSINNSHSKMSNGKNSITDEEINNKNDYYIPREIIVKDVSTRDRRINVYIKYIEYFNYNFINRKAKKNLLILFQSDSIYIPSAYPQKNNLYQNNSKYYKNMNDKNNHNKMNKILSSIIEEEERSKAAGSMNNSINSEDENLKNGNYTYFFIQSIKYFIDFLQSIFNDKKKTYYFQFFKHLKKIKNDSYLKGLISQKKIQTLNKIKEDKDNSENKNNTSGDILLYNINDNLDFDINSFNGIKNENQNPKNKYKNNNNTSEGKYSIDNNNFCLFIDENTYKISESNKKSKINLSMDNFYLNKKEENKKYDKNIFKKILNDIEINNKIKNDEISFNGQNEINNNIINKENDKNIYLNDINDKFSDFINKFRVCLMKKKKKK